ncbi:MAG: RNA polymerase sigma factor [Syntrophomonas sp.]
MRYLDKLQANKIIQGDVKAFEILIESYKGRVFSYCLRMSNDHHASEDLTQEVFLKVYRNMQYYDSHKAALNTWIYTICRHTCLNYVRDRERAGMDTALAEPDTLGCSGDPYRSLDNRLCLIRALNKLSLEERELLIMKDYLDFKYREIAKLLGLPVGTIKSRIHSTRMRVKQELEETR